MIVLLQLIAIGIFILIIVNVFNGIRNKGGSARVDHADGDVIEGTATEVSSPAKSAAETLKQFENARAELKARYPLTFSMLGGYLNEHTIHEHGGLEGAVKEMILDWSARREEVSKELAHVLAENEDEAELRAIVLAACDASFDEEGYRKWLTWLMGRFNG